MKMIETGEAPVDLDRLSANLPRFSEAALPAVKQTIDRIPDDVDRATAQSLFAAEVRRRRGSADEFEEREPSTETGGELAKPEIEPAKELENEATRKWCERGMAFVHAGRIFDGIDCFRKAVDADPTSSLALDLLGIHLLKAHLTDEALDVLECSLEMDAADAVALNAMGATLVTLGRPEEALGFLDKALEAARTPDYAKDLFRPSLVLKTRASAFTSLGKNVAAIKDLKSASKHDPNNAEIFLLLGEAYVRANMTGKACLAFQESVEIDPDHAFAWNGLGWSQYNLGQSREAIVSLRRSVDIEPNLCDSLCNLGIVLTEEGDAEEALGYLQKAVTLDPVESKYLWWLADCERKLGNRDGASRALKKVLNLDSPVEMADAALEILAELEEDSV